MEDFERARVDAYFRRITGHFEVPRKPASILVTHMLADRPALVAATARLSSVASVLPKPKSIDHDALSEVGRCFQVDQLDRRRLADSAQAVAFLEGRAAGEDVVLLDIGGYFAPALPDMCAQFSGQVLGVVEDTENGLDKYLQHAKLPCPVFSVARSPLKEPEDYLVGQSVAFSAEALVRSRGDILQGRAACVIGYGKVGSSAARMAHARNVPVTVHDTDPVRTVQALAHGFRAAGSAGAAMRGAGLVVLATGNLALKADDFRHIPNGAYVGTVTSSDDELELEALDGLYAREQVAEHVTRYSATGHYFYLLNDGEAVNFIHGACVGPFISLCRVRSWPASPCLPASRTTPACTRYRPMSVNSSRPPGCTTSMEPPRDHLM